VHRPSILRRIFERDLPSGSLVHRNFSDGGEFEGAALMHLEDINLTTGFAVVQNYRIGASNRLSARAEITGCAMLQRESWTSEVRAAVKLRATRDSFIVTARLTAHHGEGEIVARIWEEKIPRDLM
jgi:hypothetical protein